MISGSYFILIKKDKHRESQNLIQTGFDLVSDDLSNRLKSYTQGFDEFLKQSIDIHWVTDSYYRDKSVLSSLDYIVTGLSKTAEGIRKFASIIQADRLILYAQDRRVLVVYQSHGQKETLGAYVVTDVAGKKKDTYISMDNFSQLYSTFFSQTLIPYTPLPKGVYATYKGKLPDNIFASLFTRRKQVGIRISAPVYHNGNRTAVLVGEIFITQAMVDRYSRLSKTHLNFFVGRKWSVGTLPAQNKLKSKDLQQIDAWKDIREKKGKVKISPIRVGAQDFYQGRAAIKSGSNIIGAITISLSQEIEKKEIKNILITIVGISMIVIPGSLIYFLLLTRKSVHFVQQLILYIDRMSKGDIPEKISQKYKGEFELVRNNLNRLIDTTNEASRIAEQIAAGDLAEDVIKRSEHDRLMSALDFLNKGLEKRVREKVDELSQAHGKMEENEALLRSFIQTIPDLVWLKDIQGAYILCNPKFESLFGAKENDIIGNTDYDFVDKCLADSFRKQDKVAMAQGKHCINEEEVVFAVDGHREILETIKTPMYGGDGNLTGVLGIGRDITGRKLAEEQIKTSLKEKEILLREIHHRTKNNMQVLSSLLGLQANQVNEKKYKDLLKDSQERIKAMALIHEKLYQSKDLTKIDFGTYVDTLVKGLISSHASKFGQIKVETQFDDILIGIDNGVPCGLIINELVTNSLKYAFSPDGSGTIVLTLRSIAENEVGLTVSDDGIGIPDDFDFKSTESLGLHLVKILVERQLHGSIELNKINGTKFYIRFKPTPDKIRI